MLAREKRVPIERTKKGKPQKIIRTPHLLVRAFPSAKKTHRLSVIVGRYAFKKATERNKWKRKTITVFKNKLTTLSPQDYVVSITTGKALTEETLVRELAKAQKELQ